MAITSNAKKRCNDKNSRLVVAMYAECVHENLALCTVLVFWISFSNYLIKACESNWMRGGRGRSGVNIYWQIGIDLMEAGAVTAELTTLSQRGKNRLVVSVNASRSALRCYLRREEWVSLSQEQWAREWSLSTSSSSILSGSSSTSLRYVGLSSITEKPKGQDQAVGAWQDSLNGSWSGQTTTKE